MAADKNQLSQEICVLKSKAYDVLANLEFLQKQFQSQSQELQKELGNINGQIASKDQLLQSLTAEEEAARKRQESKELQQSKELLTEEK